MDKYYITTSIVYTNASPHIGFVLECVQADVLARWQRSLGKNVYFLTGTDEHGTKIFRKAQEFKKNPQDFVNEIAEQVKKMAEILNISNTDFIRTTDQKRHWPVVEKVWSKIKENNDIYLKKYQGLYCSGCEAFITEKDLKKGKCFIHGKKPEIVEEENYFFRLSKYQDILKEKIKSDEIKIIPQTRKNEVLSFISQGLEDVSFSRSKEKLDWGIPVPGDDSQIIYVWADALSNYISALDYDSRKFRKYWPADVHCIGKDILKFHALIWPAMLLSLGLDLPKNIFVHGFIGVNGQKMSKSLGNVIGPFKLVKKYGTDAVRYYLLREIPSAEDGDFSYEKFEQRYNSDLAKGIGNLLARVRVMAEGISFKEDNFKILKPKIKETLKNYKKALEEFKFNEALKAIWDLIGLCDKYIEQEKPWEKKENSPLVLGELLFVLDNIAELLEPFMPETAQKIREEITRKNNKFLNSRSKILFPKI